jgi:hypothetical protein
MTNTNNQYYWKKDNRYYKIIFQANLFGGTDIICCWGSLNSKLGNYKIIPCSNSVELEQNLNAVIKRRTARGYKLC